MCITNLSRDSCRNLICKNLGRDHQHRFTTTAGVKQNGVPWCLLRGVPGGGLPAVADDDAQDLFTSTSPTGPQHQPAPHAQHRAREPARPTPVPARLND